jgi:hypothetical protein
VIETALNLVPSVAALLYALLYLAIGINVFAATFGSRPWDENLKSAGVLVIYALLIKFVLA